MTSPERVWSWSFNDWQEGWGGYARKEHLAPICEKERDTGSEYVRIDLFKSQQAKLAKAMESIKQSIKLWEKPVADREYKLDNAYDGFELLCLALAELEK